MGESRHLLNGDIIELALTNTNGTAMLFDCFMGLAMPRNKELFWKIIYIPGNHDHHLWELARERKYVEYIRTLRGKELPIPWHTTKVLLKKEVERVHSSDKNSLIGGVWEKWGCVPRKKSQYRGAWVIRLRGGLRGMQGQGKRGLREDKLIEFYCIEYFYEAACCQIPFLPCGETNTSMRY